MNDALALIATGDRAVFEIIGLSLRLSLTATLIASLFALPLGAIFALFHFPTRGIWIWIVTSLLALPPVVVGLLVYLLLSRAGPLGELGLIFTVPAMIIAQSILVFPILTALTLQAVEPLSREYKALFEAYDLSTYQKLKTLLWDARFGLIMAFLAGLGRALSEVGAVIIVGGNISGLTRVMTTTIALETSKGNLELAIALGIVLLLAALLINAVLHLVGLWGQRYDAPREV